MPYVLPIKKIDPAAVGDSYHLALGLTSPGQSSPDRIFGYLLAEGSKFQQNTDIKTRDQLTQNASPNLIDRDFVSTPRVSQGDFSGGSLQINWLDPTKYWDSDLDTRVPGYLFLNPNWLQSQVQTGGAVGTMQCCSLANDIVTTFGTIPVNSSGIQFVGFGSNVLYIDSDGDRLYGSDGTNIKFYAGAGTWTALGGGVCTAHDRIWVVDQGTAGKFVYYRTNNARRLKKLDMAAGTRDIDVPTAGSDATTYFSGRIIVDLCAYSAGVAIVTVDPSGTGFDVWSHDGAQLQRMIRVNGLIPGGICSCLGQLYVTAYASNKWDPPVLLRIGEGGFEIVRRIGRPFVAQTASQVGAPISTGEFVYFPLFTPQINNVSQAPYIGVYSTLTGAYWHYPNLTVADMMQVNDSSGGVPRVMCAIGRSVAFPFIASGNGWVQYQANSFFFPPSSALYALQGWLLSSRIDFATPGIEKQFRRILIHHAPLQAGEVIEIRARVDSDPVFNTAGAAPIPAGAAAINPVVGSDTTVLVLPQRTLGYSMTFALRLHSGTGQATTPFVYYISIEVSVSWTWKFTVDCSSRRRILNGGEDQQGLNAKDLVMLIQTAWENALPLTFYHPNGLVYTSVIEEAMFESENPLVLVTPEHSADLEGVWTLTLRDSLA